MPHAPPTGSPEARRPAAPPASEDEGQSPLRRWVGLDAARELIGVDDERAIERLGPLRSPAALQELVLLAEDPQRLSARALVLLSRELGLRSREVGSVRALYAIVARGGGGASRERPQELLELARAQAALALARGGQREGLQLLARMVKRGHEDGELASRAFLAHPPNELEALLESPGAPNVTLVALLEALGDQRAFLPLREYVRGGTPVVQARAAIALTRLGHLETLPLARHWLSKPSGPEQLRAATEILQQVRAPDAAEAWQELYASAPEEAIALAFMHPQPALVAAISERLGADDDPRRWTLLGHAGGEESVRLLAKALGSKQASTVLYALVRSPEDSAGDALLGALEAASAESRRLVAAALVTRSVLRGESFAELRDALDALRASGEPADRAVGIWGRAALDPEYARLQLDSESDLALAASVATAGVQGPAFFERCAEVLGRERRAQRREWLGIALLHPEAVDAVPTHALQRWVDERSPLTHLALTALAQRDDPRLAGRIEAWLASTESATRSATALGLGRQRAAWATGKLARAFRFEPEADVRLSIVIALSQRSRAAVRDGLLERARELDPDSRVRTAARLALAGQVLTPDRVGREVAWVELEPGSAPSSLVLSASGGAVAVVPTLGRRVVPVLGVPTTDARVGLAPPAPAGDDAGRDARKEESARDRKRP